MKWNKEITGYFSLIKFSHTIFAMPFALIGFFLATEYQGYPFSWVKLGLVLLCMVFARNAAMAFNRYTDRIIDEKNPRTASREIPKGVIKPAYALVFVIANSLLFIATTWFINSLTFFLSPVALLVILGYSFTKKFTALCHFVLGIGLSLAPIGAYLAVSGKFDLLPLMYSLVVLFWASGFDVLYALQDEDFDKSNKLKSLPVFLGQKGAMLVSSAIHLLTAVFIITAAIKGSFGILHWTGVGVFISLLTYQHIVVKKNGLKKINLAFFTTNGIASVVFSLFFISDLFLS